MFFSSSMRAPSCAPSCHYTQYILCHKSRSVYHTVLFHFLYTLGNPHFRDLNGSDLWSNFLIATPAFSTTLILKPCHFISFWYLLYSCEFGVAGVEITASFQPFLYPLLLFLAFSWSCSSLFHSLDRCNGLSPS